MSIINIQSPNTDGVPMLNTPLFPPSLNMDKTNVFKFFDKHETYSDSISYSTLPTRFNVTPQLSPVLEAATQPSQPFNTVDQRGLKPKSKLIKKSRPLKRSYLALNDKQLLKSNLIDKPRLQLPEFSKLDELSVIQQSSLIKSIYLDSLININQKEKTVFSLISQIRCPSIQNKTLQQVGIVHPSMVVQNHDCSQQIQDSFNIKLALPCNQEDDAILIGLAVRAKLKMNLPLSHKFDIEFIKGTVTDLSDIQKQINDKESVSAAFEKEELWNKILELTI